MKKNAIKDKDRKCLDCYEDYPTMFILKDHIWNSVAKRKDVLCFDCTQKRLNRNIVLEDLKECGITDEYLLGIRIYLQS